MYARFYSWEPNFHKLMIEHLLQNDPFLFDNLQLKLYQININKSSINVPSAKNSGFDKTSKLYFELEFSRIYFIVSAVLTGIVDFSTIILSELENLAIVRAQDSTYFKSADCFFLFHKS